MLIGIPSEIKTHEYRVGLTPYNAGELIKQSNQTLKEILDTSMDDIEEVIKLEGKLNKKIKE